MVRLMSDAGIRPQTTQIRSGDDALSRITGAQAPSGIPVVITAPVSNVPSAAPPPEADAAPIRRPGARPYAVRLRRGLNPYPSDRQDRHEPTLPFSGFPSQ